MAKKKQRRAKKKATRLRKVGPPAALEVKVARWAVEGAWISERWAETGTTWVLISYRAPHGGLAMSGWLVDLYCVGVKDAFVREVDSGELEDMVEGRRGDPLSSCSPELAAKLLVTGQSYAESLGFRPIAEWSRLRGLLAGIDHGACEVPVECGKDGKPFYIAGPNDNPNVVLRRLKKRLGPDGYHFIAPVKNM